MRYRTNFSRLLSKTAIAVHVVFALWVSPAAALEGEARIVDGDTLVIDGERIRLHGIDAPESAQRCGTGPGWSCGRQATAALTEMIGGQPVRCEGCERDRYKRLIAVCYVGSLDLNRAMVAQGMALAYRQYSRDYVPAEDEARASGAGMWAGPFVPPWEWRRGVR